MTDLKKGREGGQRVLKNIAIGEGTFSKDINETA